MKLLYNFKLLKLLIGIIGLVGLVIASPEPVYANGPEGNLLIFYRESSQTGSPCLGPMTLSAFLKRTLAKEVRGLISPEALKANAIAARSFTLSPQNADLYIHTDGNAYHCTHAWKQSGFLDDAPLLTKTNNAVVDTEGVILTHPTVTNRETFENWPLEMRFGAIDARYTKENGPLTQEDPQHAWLKEVYDPISLGRSPVNPSFFYGMGQDASERWANGVDPLTGNDFPKWDYQRILAHYYSEVTFVGIIPSPPNDYRINIVEVGGIPPNGGLVLCKGEERTGIILRSQNTGGPLPVDNAAFPGFCSGITTPQTLVGYHLYKEDGTPVNCPNCTGVRTTPLCYPGSVIPSGGDHYSSGFKVFMPNHETLIEGNSYLLRFDILNGGIWRGKSNNFPWPPQDIPVEVCDPNAGGGELAPIITSYPPGIVSYADLNNGYYTFSWDGRNGSGNYEFDVQFRNKDIISPTYPSEFEAPAPFQNTEARTVDLPVNNCTFDGRDWQFQVRVEDRDTNEESDWVQVEARTLVYVHPLLTQPQITQLVDVDDPDTSWPQSIGIVNLRGGTFTWIASSNQSWIQVNSSGQENETLGVTLNKPAAEGTFNGTITVNIVDWSPGELYCNRTESGDLVTTFNIPVKLIIADLERVYLPIIR
ncbi:MAG: SpoIID/LytB domain-containing protein, partial [Chloroflexota bacterium]|nr:SpoIID/LytB domain-containing protein [Chloroflexota bacterium]